MTDSKELLAELRHALAHLDDPPRLENHPLIRRIPFVAEAPDLSRGQLLRRTLKLAIETLDPDPALRSDAPRAHSYQVLQRYAVGKQSMTAIASELGVSERQAYRELRRAVEALAQILCEDDLGLGPRPGQRLDMPSLRQEVERLSDGSSQDLNLARLVEAVVESARHLGEEKGTPIRLETEEADLHVTATRVMLRQALLNLLSHMVRVSGGAEVCVRIRGSAEEALVEFTYCANSLPDALPSHAPYEVAAQLFELMGLRWQREEAKSGMVRVVVPIPLAPTHKVLIVDDNEGTIALFRRYLRHKQYQVLVASDARQALELLEQADPEVVILDVMIPDRDGWEILELLRARQRDPQPRVIVCSIINDPELAAALGADAFLHKPVSRAQLLQTLGRLARAV